MAFDFNKYYDLRENFIYVLDGQYSINTKVNPYDPTGQISRMAARGDSKAKILELLEANSTYRANVKLLESTDEDQDPIEKAVLILFKELKEEVDTLEDPPAPVDVREMAAESLELAYEGSQDAAQMIRDGASSVDVFKALDNVPSWSDTLQDYMSRMEVEYVQRYQYEKWSTFEDVMDIIKDTDLYK
jgi:hypothetical protein